jgi:hypothetical protein
MHGTFEVAQLNIQDIKLVVVFVSEAPGVETREAIDHAASKAGLDGEVVVVWPDEFGRTRFFARETRHEFLRVVGLDQLRAQINATLLL